MSKFRVGDKVVLINVDHYSDIMKQLMGKALVVNSIDTDKCGCEIVCARVPGEEGWFLYSEDLQLVSETQPKLAPQKPLRRGHLVKYDGKICVVVSKGVDCDGDYRIMSMTDKPDYFWANIYELTKIGSVRKKIKRLQAQMEECK